MSQPRDLDGPPVRSVTAGLDDERKRHSGPTNGTRCIGTTSRSASSPSVVALAPSLSQRPGQAWLVRSPNDSHHTRAAAPFERAACEQSPSGMSSKNPELVVARAHGSFWASIAAETL